MLDFVSYRLLDGRWFRVLTMVDQFALVAGGARPSVAGDVRLLRDQADAQPALSTVGCALPFDRPEYPNDNAKR